MPSLRIAAFTIMADPDIMKEIMSQFPALEEDRFIAESKRKVLA